MKNLINTDNLLKLFDDYINKWHINSNTDFSEENLFKKQSIEILCSNYKLWHLEDLARDINASDKIIADVKRKIDKENQIRNDNIEKLDFYILKYLQEENIKPATNEMNSETPGSIVDKITILSLKIYHMLEETNRKDVSEEHIKRCREKLEILKEQRFDLANALKKLIYDILNGNKKHKVYYQFKMYNDPDLNPVLYKNKRNNS